MYTGIYISTPIYLFTCTHFYAHRRAKYVYILLRPYTQNICIYFYASIPKREYILLLPYTDTWLHSLQAYVHSCLYTLFIYIVCPRLYMFIHVYVHIPKLVCIRWCPYTTTRVYMYEYIPINDYILLYTYTPYMFTYINTHDDIYMFIFIHAHIRSIHLYIPLHPYIYTCLSTTTPIYLYKFT